MSCTDLEWGEGSTSVWLVAAHGMFDVVTVILTRFFHIDVVNDAQNNL